LHAEVSHFSALKTASQRENIQKISKTEKLREQDGKRLIVAANRETNELAM